MDELSNMTARGRDYDTSAKVARDSQVQREVSQLEKAQAETRELLGELESRLGSALRDRPPEAESAAKPTKEPLVPLAEVIGGQAERQQQFNVALHSIIHRLEL